MANSETILITHVINPHMFWFHSDTLVNQNKNLQKLNREIEDYYELEQNVTDKTYAPSIGEIVGVYKNSWRKWIRARVHKIITYTHNEDKLILWAIDSGIPFATSIKLIRRLPTHLANQNVNAIHFAGINNILPAEKRFNFLKGETETIIKKSWSKTAIKHFEDLMLAAAEIKFIRERLINNQVFGSLKFVTCSNEEFDLGEVLVRITQAAQTTNFLLDLQQLHTTKISCFHDNENNLSSVIKDNVLNVEQINIKTKDFQDECQSEEISEKISAWTIKNERIIENEHNLTDCDFQDSASAVIAPNSETHKYSHQNTYVNDSFYTGRGFNDIETILKTCETSIRPVDSESMGDSLSSQAKSKVSSKSDSSFKNSILRTRDVNVAAIRKMVMAKLSVPKIVPAGFDLTKINSSKTEQKVSANMNSKQVQKLPVKIPETITDSQIQQPSCSMVNQPLNLSEKFEQKQPSHLNSPRSSYRHKNCVLGENGNNINVFVNGKNIPTPIKNLAEANFLPKIYEEFNRNRIGEIYRIQSYSWPHLSRGNSLVIVNSHSTGKTLGYAPSLYSSVMINVEATIQSVGPIAIIICSSSIEASAINNLCKSFNDHRKGKSLDIFMATGYRSQTNFVTKLLNGCDILITTPRCLIRLLNHTINLFDTNRLKHLIIDNIDTMMDNLKEDLELIFKRCTSFAKTDLISQQIIITSRSWHPYLLSILKKTINPILLIGAYIEACVYAKSNISLRLQPNEDKCSALLGYLTKVSSKFERTVIVCSNQEEVEEISRVFKSKSILHIPCHENSKEIELELAKEWRKHIPGELQVLVCSDTVLNELKVTTAKNLVHYSLSSSWTKFSYRFSTLFDYIPDFFKNNNQNEQKPDILILLDESNNKHLPKLIDFIKLHNPKSINKNIQILANKIRLDNEQIKGNISTDLCKYFLEYSKCYKENSCKDRHIFIQSDKLIDNYPTKGTVRLQILSVHSPIFYTARLLSVKDANNKWKTIEQSQGYSAFKLKLLQYYMNNPQCPNHWPIEVKDICTYSSDDAFYRCEILNIENKRLGSKLIYIRCIDSGDRIMCKQTDLLFIPDELKSFPPQGFDVRLCGLVPFDFDHEWDHQGVTIVKNWLLSKEYINCTVEANIQLALNYRIWVNSLVIVEHLEGIGTKIPKIFIKENLVAKELADVDTKPIKVLINAALECGIYGIPEEEYIGIPEEESISNYRIYEEPDQNKECTEAIGNTTQETGNIALGDDSVSCKENLNIEQIKEKSNKRAEVWEVLEEDIFNKVFIGCFLHPNEFFVQRYSNFEGIVLLYEKLKEFAESARNLEKIELGALCLYRDTLKNGDFYRGKICKIEDNDNVLVFCCDTGITEQTNINNLFEISDDLLELPFQSIKCKLVGILPKETDNWVDEISDKIFDNLIDCCYDSLYARHFLVHEPEESLNILSLKTYEIILVDCSTENNIVINKAIAQKGMGKFDTKTEYFLDIVINSNLGNNKKQYRGRHWDESDNSDQEVMSLKSTENDMLLDFDIEFDFEDVKQLDPALSEVEPHFSEKFEASIVEINENATECQINDSQTDEYSKTNETNIVNELSPEKRNEPKMPLLVSLYNCPNVIWHQSDVFIYLTISATDVLNYSLKVRDSSVLVRLLYATKEENLCINFCGCFDSKFTFHEIRGLNLHLRLVKLLKGITWPMLTYENDNHKWLSYNINHISTEEMVYNMNTPACYKRTVISDDSSDKTEDDFDELDNDLL